MDKNIVKYLSKIDNYNRYNKFIKLDNLLEDYRDIIKDFEKYFDQTDETTINWDNFSTWYLTIVHPNLREGKAAAIKRACEALKETAYPQDNRIFLSLVDRHYGVLLSDLGDKVANGDIEKPQEKLKKLFREWSFEYRGREKEIAGSSVTDEDFIEMLQKEKDLPRYNWSLPELNLILGPIAQGNFIVLGARPDGGKTTFLATQTVHFLSQLKENECVLWCNNEQREPDVLKRIMQARLGWTDEEIISDGKKSWEMFCDKIGGRQKLRLYSNNDMDVYDIEEEVLALQGSGFYPKIIIMDQIWKLGGFEKEYQGIERYGKIAQWMRSLANDIGPIIAASQLGGEATNKRYPTADMFYNSKTALQGEADALLTIGKTENDPANVRWLAAPKNKLSHRDEAFGDTGAAIEIDRFRAQLISKIGKQYHVQP